MFDWTKLNNYSFKIAHLIFEKYPEWKKWAINGSADNWNEPCNDSILIQIPSPIGNESLIIDTHGDEITLVFDDFHTHLGGCDSIEEDFEEALIMIEQIMNEKWVIISSSSKNSYSISAIMLSEVISLDSAIKEHILDYESRNNEKPIKTYVLSWKGTYSKKI